MLLKAWGERLGASSGFLFGRRTYEDVLGYWNTQESPFREALNSAAKYVVSSTLSGSPAWPNTTLLGGDAPAAVTELKKAKGDDLHIMGSGMLIRSLSPLGLIDEYVLSIHPLVLGTGHRLFGDGPTGLCLRSAITTTTGVIVASYGRAIDAGRY